MELLFNEVSQGFVFHDIPSSETLYFAARLCGHSSKNAFTIIDDVSTVDYDLSIEYDPSLVLSFET